MIQALARIKLKQKRYQHRPQAKVLAFLVATLAGLKYLQEFSLAAHPLAKDQAVAEAWGPAGWADYTGISRSLSQLSWPEVDQIVQALPQVSQAFGAAEIERLEAQGQRLRFDGDLTGLPVSHTSPSYPNAAFGHMDDEIRLGYQAGVVSLVSPTYGRLWLSASHHPGDTISCTQAEALVLLAEARTGRRPRRRTALLQERLAAFQTHLAVIQQRLEAQQQAVTKAQTRLEAAGQQARVRRQELDQLTQTYQTQQRPTSRLVKVRHGCQVAAQKRDRGQQSLAQAQQRLAKTQLRLAQQQTALARLQRFEQDNATNPNPTAAEFRLEAGFGTYENVALVIEMGYDLYPKPYSRQVVGHLKSKVTPQTR